MTRDRRKSLEDEMSDMQAEFQRLLDMAMGQHLGYLLISRGSYTWQPATDVYETDDALVVKVDLAGVDCRDLHIVLAGGTLTISGRRDNRPEVRKIAYHQMGVSYGDFLTQINIPVKVDEGRANAYYSDGFLYIQLPKAVEGHLEATRITITVLTNEESSR